MEHIKPLRVEDYTYAKKLPKNPETFRDATRYLIKFHIKCMQRVQAQMLYHQLLTIGTLSI